MNSSENRIAELIVGAAARGTSRDSDAFLDACLAAAHRRHFFPILGGRLKRRGQTLTKAVDDHKLLAQDKKPGKAQWQAFCEGRPLTLGGILKIDAALVVFANHKDAALGELTSVGGTPFVLGADSVSASIYFAEPAQFLDFRAQRVGKRREKFSLQIFGNGNHHTLRLLEHGDNTGRQVRVTAATIQRIAEVLGSDVAELFTHDCTAGIRNGENTFALSVRMGNVLV